MKRTLFVMFDFPPSTGGAQTYDSDMVRACPREKVIIVAGKSGTWRDFDRESGYTTYRLPKGTMEKLTIPALVPIVAFLAVRERVERIWFSKYNRMIYFTTLFTSHVLGLPYGLTVFGEDQVWAVDDFGLQWPRCAVALRDLAIRGASKIVANSEFCASFLPSDIRGSVIYPCLNPENPALQQEGR